MDTKIKFGAAEQGNVDLVRHLVWERLRRKEKWNQLSVPDSSFDNFVSFEDQAYRFSFGNVVREVIWELIGLGILVPGQPSSQTCQSTGYAAWNLPWFEVSAYGRHVIDAGRVIPQDPYGYLIEAKSTASLCFGDVGEGYLEEALRCFTRSCYTASVLLLGVATEASFLQLCDVYEKSIQNPNLRSKFAKLPYIKSKHRQIVEKYEALRGEVKHGQLPDGLDLTLKGAYDLIRRQRNDLGHPQDVRPETDRAHAFVSFQLFLTYLRDIEAFARYIQTNGL